MNNMEDLVKKAANGDRAAFDELYTLTSRGVWYTCISLLKNEENAKDIMQDTYLTAYERLRELKNPASAQSWLNRIAANKCKNFLTSGANKKAEEAEEILENIPDDFLLPDEYVTDKANRKIIMDIIKNALSEEQFQTVILYYFDELTAAEIAELMDCHEKTVLYRLKTARKKIKEAILQYEEENKDKLHGAVPVIFLPRLLKADAEDAAVPEIAPILSASPQTSMPPKTSKREQAQTHSNDDSLYIPPQYSANAANTGGKRMFDSLRSKIIAGVCTAAVVIGGSVTAVIVTNGGGQRGDLPAAVITDSTQQTASEAITRPLSSEAGETHSEEITHKPEKTEVIEKTDDTEKTSEAEKTNSPEKTNEPEKTNPPESTKIPETANAPDKTDPPTATPDIIAMSDEIVKAKLDSCLMQINNQIIKQGGYMTVKEFVKTNGNCDFLYLKKPYEETKDYLLSYKDLDSLAYNDDFLEVVPKTGSSFRLIIANCTSPDEKITVENAIVIKAENFMSGHCPIWTPKGWAATNFSLSFPFSGNKNDLTSTNKDYALKDFPDFLKNEGIVEYGGEAHLFPPCTLENCKKYVRNDNDGFGFYVAGETNLFGARPIFKYWIFFDPNTDKMKNEVTNYELVGFLTE